MSFIEEEFNKLVENAFDFLEKALDEIKVNPKFSVINFYTAIELFFKARLLHEHWALILSDPGSANKTKFLQGDFHSVSLNDCCTRLKNISGGSEVYDKELKLFENIKLHRNKLVHFYNKDYSKPISEKTINTIALEQFQGVLVLNRLLSNNWKLFFSGFSARASKLDSKMTCHHEYLEKKFAELNSKIVGLKSKGKIKNCNSCNYESLEKLDTDEPIVFLKCLVCNSFENHLLYYCEDCTTHFHTPVNQGSAVCPKCENELMSEEVLENFSIGYDSHPGDYECDTDYLCPGCEENKIVQTSSENYFCLNCEDIYETTSCCEWCSQLYLGDIGDGSYATGCSMCDGLMGWHKDD